MGAVQGLPVSWSDPQPSGSTVSAATTALSSGQTGVTYNSNAAVGPGHVVAAFDNASATAAITVDQAPAITSGNSVNFNIGTFGSFTVTATGYPMPAITKSVALPSGLTLVDNGDGTATLSGTPAAGTGGTYTIPLTASNGVGANATQNLTLQIGAPPAFTSSANATFTVGTNSTFTVTTSGSPTVTSISRGAAAPPTGLTYTDNHDGTATLSGTPAAGTGGTYTLSLTATNGVTPDATQSLVIAVNQAPAVTTNPSSQTVNPGASVTFTAAASGAPTPTVQWQRSTNGGASYANIAGASSTSYTFTATGAGSGSKYRAVFTNVVSSATTTAATLTVGNSPSISSANATTFTVGTVGTFAVTTSGFPSPAITHSALPSWLLLDDNGDGTATLHGTPPVGSGGIVSFTIYADNGFNPSDSQAFTLNVDEAPTITSADNTTFTVGSAGSFAVTTDAGFPVATGFAITPALPTGLSLTDQRNGSALLHGTPVAAEGGVHAYTISANATGGTTAPATQTFTLTIDESPTITSADRVTFAVGVNATFTVTTAGGYPSPPVLSQTSSPALPTGVQFSDQGDGTATLRGTPPVGSGGTYVLSIKAASGGTAADATQTFTLTIDEPPTITSTDHATFTLGAAAAFTVTTTPGVSADPVTISTPAAGLPAGITLSDNGDGTAVLGGTPTEGGVFTFTITASNQTPPDATQSFTLTINQPPAITSADHVTFAVGTDSSFTVTTTAGTPSSTTISESGDTPPTGVSFVNRPDGTATLQGTPAAATGGVYTFTIKAANAAGFSTQSFTLTVDELPSITSANAITFTVGAAGSFPVTTSPGYPAATTLTEDSGNRPAAWLSFDDNGDGSASLHGTPPAASGGTITLQIRASNAYGSRVQAFTLTIDESPVITSADQAAFDVGTAGSFTVTTTAGNPPSTVITGPTQAELPSGVSFDAGTDGTASLHGTPAVGTGGVYTFTIKAANASGFVTQSFTLTVDELPAITSANSTIFTVGTAGTFDVSTTAGYPAATTLSATLLSGLPLPSWLVFTDNNDGSAILTGTPPAGSGGTFVLQIKAANAAGSNTQAFTLSIDESPAISSPNSTTFTAGTSGSFTVMTSGGFPTPPALSIDDNLDNSRLPAGVSFVDNHDGTALLSGNAAVEGSYTFTIRAGNGASVDATQSFTLTVNGPPSITSGDQMGFTAGVPGTFLVTTRAGVPATPITVSETGRLPAGVSFVDQGDGTAVLSGTAPPSAIASYSITIKASNGIAPDSSQSFVLLISRAQMVNLPPSPPASGVPFVGVPATTFDGQLVQLSGSGCAAGAPVTLGYYPPRTTLGQVTADSSGSFSATVRMPDLLGSHVLVAACYGVDGKVRYFTAHITVVRPQQESSGGSVPISGNGPGTTIGDLANTGPDTDPRTAAGYAAVLLLVGFALVLITRRRRGIRD